MALRKIGAIGRLTKVATKVGLAGGAVYIYYEVGLWKGSDETIKNYDKFKKDCQLLYDAAPTDVKKWTEYSKTTASSNILPYCKAASEFRKEWFNWDLSWFMESGDGVIKPTWNRGVSWTIEALMDSPATISRWGSTGWHKLTELVNENAAAPSSDAAKQ